METESIINSFFSLLFVIALIGISAFVFQKISFSKTFLNKMPEKRLKLLDFLVIDAKRKIVVVENQSEEITILVGMNDEKIISVKNKPTKARKK